MIGLLSMVVLVVNFFITVSAFELLSTGFYASLSIQVDLSNNKDTAVLMVVQVVPVVPDVPIVPGLVVASGCAILILGCV